jgi:hypothetical protein
VIDAFKFVDNRQSRSRRLAEAVAPSAELKQVVDVHLDVLAAIVSLLFKPKVGMHARDAIIMAISMHDKRVDAFLLYHSSFIDDLMRELISRHNEWTDNSFMNDAGSNPMFKSTRASVTGTNGFTTPTKDKEAAKAKSPESPPPPSPLEQRSHGFQGIEQEETTPSAMERFLEIVVFIDTVIQASNKNPTYDVYLLDDCSVKNTLGVTIQERLLDLFQHKYLQQHLIPTLLMNAEHQIIAACTILSAVLNNLHLVNNDSFLLSSTINLVLSHQDGCVLELLMTRCASISKAVAISNLKLMSTLLRVSRHLEALRILNFTSTTTVATNSIETLDLTLIELIEVLPTYSINAPISKLSNGKDLSPRSTSEFKQMSFSVDSEKDILLRVQSYKLSANSPPAFIVPANAMLHLISRRIDSFLTSNLDEQLAMGTLLGHVSCILCSNVVFLSQSVHASSDEINTLRYILHKLEEIWISLSRNYLPRISQLDWKYKAVQHILAKYEIPELAPLANQVDGSPRLNMIETAAVQYIKLFELESPQSKRILESAVIVRSIFLNIQAHVLSVKRLLPILVISCKTSSQMLNDSLSCSLLSFISEADIELDEFEVEADKEELAKLALSPTSTANPLIDCHDSFLQELAMLETHLDELIGN